MEIWVLKAKVKSQNVANVVWHSGLLVRIFSHQKNISLYCWLKKIQCNTDVIFLPKSRLKYIYKGITATLMNITSTFRFNYWIIMIIIKFCLGLLLSLYAPCSDSSICVWINLPWPCCVIVLHVTVYFNRCSSLPLHLYFSVFFCKVIST